MNPKSLKVIFLLFKKLYWNYRYKLLLLFALSVVSGFLGALGIAAIVPLFTFIVEGGGVSNNFVSNLITRIFIYLNIDVELISLLIFISSLFVLKAIILWFFGLIRAKVISIYLYQTRSALYKKAIFANWQYLLKHKIGYLENILMTDMNASVVFLKRIISFILKSTSMVMYLVVAFSISAFITSLALGMGAIILVSAKSFIRKSRIYGRENEAFSKAAAHQINENILGIKTIKAANVERKVAEQEVGIFYGLKNLAVKSYMAGSITSQPIEPISVIFISVVFAVSYSAQASFDFAAFIVIMYLVQNIFVFIESIQGTFHAFNHVLPNVQRVVNFQEEVKNNQEYASGKSEFNFKDNLEFRNVSFSHVENQNESSTLSELTFTIQKGEMFGIIGPTGSGKTTLVDLFLRLFIPTSGNIFLDGRGVDEINVNKWRKAIGYVPQDIFLKNDTIKNNIRFYNNKISEEDIIEASKKANIYDFVKTLPKGFDTIVGERGVFLSGGQRQRIVLAREFAKKPKILILDEATSSLDANSESLIKEAIEKLKGELTIIVISHRLSFITNSDNIIVLRNGKIVESGNPKELLKNQNTYLYQTINV